MRHNTNDRYLTDIQKSDLKEEEEKIKECLQVMTEDFPKKKKKVIWQTLYLNIYFINYNTIKNYILIIYELSTLRPFARCSVTDQSL